MKKSLYTIILLANCIIAFGQQPYMRKISYLDGLPTKTIFDLYLDETGYVYLGTSMGLFKYNGVHFKQFHFENTRSTAVSDIVQDNRGNIYCRNFSNQIFKLENDTLKTIAELQERISQSNSLQSFDVGQDKIWVATNSEVFSFDEKGAEIQQIFKNEDNSFRDDLLDLVYNPSDSALAFVSVDYFYRYRGGFLERQTIVNGNKRLAYFDSKYYFNLKGSENQVWNITDTVQLELGINKEKQSFYHLVKTPGFLWLCTNSGIYKVNEESNTVAEELISQGRVSDIVQDKEGNYWISTLDDGLFFVSNLYIKQYDYLSNSKVSGISYTNVKNAPNGNLLIGTNLGHVFEVDSSGNLQMEYSANKSYPIEFLFTDSIQNRFLSSQGIYKYGLAEIETEVYLGKDAIMDDKGNYVLCFHNQAVMINQDLRSAPNFPSNEKLVQARFSDLDIPIIMLHQQRTRTAHYCPISGKYYISTIDGLLIMDSHGNKKKWYIADSTDVYVSQFLAGENGSVWLATSNAGIIQVKDEQILSCIDMENGLSSNSVKMMALKNKELWALTSKGIDKIDIVSKELRSLTSAFSIKNFTINNMGLAHSKIWFATNEGVFSIPFQHTDKAFQSELFFTKILVNKAPILKNRLRYFQNNIEFHYNAIFYAAMGAYTFQYRLLGLDSSWISKSAMEQKIDFLNLPSGNFTLELKLSLGNYESETVRYNFTILKPFWQKWWFYLLEFIAFLLVIFMVYKFAQKRTRQEEIIHRKLALSQLTALRSQMNPHFLFNILNSVQGLIYSNQKNKAAEYLGKFSELMRKILTASDKQQIDLKDEVETLKLYIELEAERFEADFEYSLEVEESLLNSGYKIPSMIVQPFIENALKHGLLHKQGLKQLKMVFKISENKKHLLIHIIDNGIGRLASAELNRNKQKHSSFATHAIDRRIMLLNKQLGNPIKIEIIDFSLDKDRKTGTEVILKIPLNHE